MKVTFIPMKRFPFFFWLPYINMKDLDNLDPYPLLDLKGKFAINVGNSKIWSAFPVNKYYREKT